MIGLNNNIMIQRLLRAIVGIIFFTTLPITIIPILIIWILTNYSIPSAIMDYLADV